MLKIRTLTLIQCCYLSSGLYSILPLVPLRSLTAKENPRACVVLSCHDSSVSFNLAHYLSLSLCFMTLTFLKSTSQRFCRMSLSNATVHSSNGPLFLLPFQGQVSWRIRNHWPSWLDYLSYSFLSLSPLWLHWNHSCFRPSVNSSWPVAEIMLVSLSWALTSPCMRLP